MGNSQSAEPLSAEVLAHTPTIQMYASEYGTSEYVAVIQAIMSESWKAVMERQSIQWKETWEMRLRRIVIQFNQHLLWDME